MKAALKKPALKKTAVKKTAVKKKMTPKQKKAFAGTKIGDAITALPKKMKMYKTATKKMDMYKKGKVKKSGKK